MSDAILMTAPVAGVGAPGVAPWPQQPGDLICRVCWLLQHSTGAFLRGITAGGATWTHQPELAFRTMEAETLAAVVRANRRVFGDGLQLVSRVFYSRPQLPFDWWCDE